MRSRNGCDSSNSGYLNNENRWGKSKKKDENTGKRQHEDIPSIIRLSSGKHI